MDIDSWIEWDIELNVSQIYYRYQKYKIGTQFLEIEIDC